MGQEKILLIVGFDEIVANKYMETVFNCIEKGELSGYSIIDLEGQEKNIIGKASSLRYQPNHIYFLPYNNIDGGINVDEIVLNSIMEHYMSSKTELKVYIATEASSHEYYLRSFLSRGISTLVEKPVLCPISNGVFVPTRISSIMDELLIYSKQSKKNNSVMNLGRYSYLFHDIVYAYLNSRVERTKSPITSIHMKFCGGVWNTHKEFDTRTDHPYHYGYGMLMHGGYHYIDLVSRIMELNKKLYKRNTLKVFLTTYAAKPQHQRNRIGTIPSSMIGDYSSPSELMGSAYGETDFVTCFCLADSSKQSIISLGTISLEQTTPSVRHWAKIPQTLYNKNGRVSDIELDVVISTLHRIHLHSYDVPEKVFLDVDNIKTNARVEIWNNASLFNDEEFYYEKEFKNIRHSDANRTILHRWLKNQEDRSSLESHVLTMKLMQTIAESIMNVGTEYSVDF